jgi:sodium-dependent dicarboxylate transporter 2/3/5
VPIKKMLKGLGPISFEEKIVAIVFLLTALGWIFRKVLNETAIFSGLEDAVIAMVGGLSLFFFRSKSRKENLLEWKDLEDNFPWGLIFLFGGGMALAFVVSSTGLAQWLANLIPTNLNLILLMVLLITLIVFLTELTSNIATTMTFIPIIFAISLNLDINPLILTVPLTFAASCAFMLPVATPPNSIIFASKHVPIAEMVKVGFWLNLCAIAVIVLVGYYYIPVIFN